jgi:hypothetical protein
MHLTCPLLATDSKISPSAARSCSITSSGRARRLRVHRSECRLCQSHNTQLLRWPWSSFLSQWSQGSRRQSCAKRTRSVVVPSFDPLIDRSANVGTVPSQCLGKGHLRQAVGSRYSLSFPATVLCKSPWATPRTCPNCYSTVYRLVRHSRQIPGWGHSDGWRKPVNEQIDGPA